MKNKKIIIGIVSGIFFVILIFIFSKKSTITNYSQTVPLIKTNNESKQTSENTFILKNDISTVLWDKYTNNFKDSKISEYNTENISLESLSEKLAKKIGFLESEKTMLPKESLLWKSSSKNILYSKSSNTIEIQYVTPQTNKIGFSESLLEESVNSYILKTIPESKFQITSIDFFKEDKNIPISGNRQNSKLANVHLSQIVDGIKIIPENLSSEHTISVIIDSSLNIRTVKIREFITNYIAVSTKTNILSSQIKGIIPSEIHRLSPFSINEEDLIAQSNNTFSVTNVEIVYLMNSSKLRPVFYLNGTMSNKEKEFKNVSFIAPIPAP